MKILAVSDQVVERIYSLAANKHFQDIDMILGCGDLPYEYLEYLVTIINKPLYYIPGNHDPKYNRTDKKSRAEGGDNIDQKIISAKGLTIAGIGGSIRYHPDGINQYTQREMFFRILKLLPKLLFNRFFHGRTLDILITHSPPFGIHDDDTRAHQGLKAINLLIRWAKPRYHFHGHTHFFWQNLDVVTTQVDETQVMNIFPYKVIDV